MRSAIQLGIVIAEGFVKDQLLLRAYPLTFLTMLSIVPLLAIAVALVDLIGGGQDVVRQILDQFAAVTPEASTFILDQVGNFNFGALGGLSGAVVLITTVLQVGGIEKALNAIWGVQQQRPWVRRVPDYLAVVVVAPLLMGVAIPLRTTIESQWFVQRALDLPAFDLLYSTGLQYAPLLLSVLAFSFLYWFLPNTRVRPLSAILGGAVGAGLFGVAQVAFVAGVTQSARYGAAFGALAGVAFFMVWVYWSWCVVLFGAQVAYAHQTLGLYRREVRGEAPGPAARETIGLAIALQCATDFRQGGEPWTADRLSDTLDIPLRTVRDVLVSLSEAGILGECGGERAGAYQVSRPLDQIRVSDVLVALRGPRHAELGSSPVAGRVEQVLEEVDAAAEDLASTQSLRQLVDELPAEPLAEAGEPAEASGR